MTDSSEPTKFVFNVYDKRKLHGYVFFGKDALYHDINFSIIMRFASNNRSVPETAEFDLRKLVDAKHDVLPIDCREVIIPSTGETRARTIDDYFTYSLERPIKSTRASHYFSSFFLNQASCEKFRSFLRKSMICYTPDSYLLILGNKDVIFHLFSTLLSLKPLIKAGSMDLYCEQYVTKTVLDEVRSARVVLCDLLHRTIRVGHYPPNKRYDYTIQYHGIITKITRPEFPSAEMIERIIDVNDNCVVSQDYITPGEILNWILSG
jgi:hypothetical protein